MLPVLSSKLHGQKLHLCFGTQLCRGGEEGFPGGSDGEESICNAGDPGSILGWEDPLEKGMVAHSSILVRRIPRTEEPGGLQSRGQT